MKNPKVPRSTFSPRSKKAGRRRRRLTLIVTATAVLCLISLTAGGLFSNRVPKAQAQTDGGISPEALAQIDALIREKESRTGVEKKIDSQLIYELKMQRGEMVAQGVAELETDVEYNQQGKVAVDLKATVSDSLLDRLRAGGAEIVSAVPEHNSIRIQADIDSLESFATFPDVSYIQPKQDAATSRLEGSGLVAAKTSVAANMMPGFAGRASSVRGLVSTAIQGGAETNVAGSIPPTGVGSRSSEGDVAHRAHSARGTFHTDGTGIKIGVLSDGVTNLAASQASGDLGAVTVLPGQAGSGDEGTAMLEIIHDVAPGAQLYFATAFGSIGGFAQNIRDLRAAGCDIIVDDVFYFVETAFQDGQAPGVISNTNGGVVLQAVNDVTASGALYFSSAGNSGNLNDGTAGVWEGNFTDGGATAAPLGAGRVHQFAPGQNFNTLTLASTNPINLQWSDPLGGSSNDYDLFRLNAAGTGVAASSTNIQNGTQDPYEQVSQSITNPRIVVVKKASAQPRFLHLNTNRGRLQVATNGQTHGHSGAANAYGCAATPALAAYPNPFSAANVVETFSSDGPRRIFFNADGTPKTPGDFSATGGLLRQKPDITAADGTSVTGVGGFGSPFFGTSAAAPHAAAIAALIKSASPSITPAQMRTLLTSTALDIEAPGVDRDSGAGIVMPYNALLALGVPGTAFIEFGSITASENPGDGNGSIDAGDGASLLIQLRNAGVANATGITATLTSSSPGVIITQPNTSAYPDLASGGGSATNSTPFLFTLASNVPCPSVLNFTLTVNYTGGQSPQVLNFSVPSGPEPVNISSSIDAVAPAPAPGFTTSTGTIGVRHFRDGIAKACGTTSAFPGTTQPGTRTYDAYTFQTCPTSAPACITVTLSGTNAINLYTAAYSGNFNPADISQNFLADAGSSAASRTYSFNIPGGAQTFTVIVYDVPPGAPSGTGYALNVSGGCIGACATANQLPVAKARNVTVPADGSCLANASVDDGSFDPDGDPVTVTQSPAGPYPLGTTNVLLTVVDPRGATSQANATVTVVDNSAPVIACPSNITVNATPGACAANVTYNVTANDNCSTPTVNTSIPSGASFPVGTTTVNATATDAAGNVSNCSFNVTVLDNQAPGVTGVSATPNSLWPPNHQMINVTVNYNASDNCGTVTSVLSVASNEPINGQGDGDTAPDWQVIDAHHVLLRSERSGKGDGRVYTITVKTTDSSGNQTVKTTTVGVPKSQGKN